MAVIFKIWLWVRIASVYWFRWRYATYKMRQPFIREPQQDLLINGQGEN